MKQFLAAALCLALVSAIFFPAMARAAGFSDWAVVIVAGDDHAHDGSHAEIFDNARRDLAKAFVSIGFSPANIAQFSVEAAKDAQPTTVTAIATTLWDLTSRAPGGCLIYFTSHGSPDGIVANDVLLSPDKFATIVNNSCGAKPSVVVMSACYTGIFVAPLAASNRMVLTAARPDRTSFGCGNDFKYTFFDQCFLESMPATGNFPDLAAATIGCVGRREQQLGATPPSEPQLAIGNNVREKLRWR